MASPDIPGGAVIGTATDALVNAAESVQLSEEELQAATAIGFDNKMLLHFEVSLGIEQASMLLAMSLLKFQLFPMWGEQIHIGPVLRCVPCWW
jgi:hypothetical protein